MWFVFLSQDCFGYANILIEGIIRSIIINELIIQLYQLAGLLYLGYYTYYIIYENDNNNKLNNSLFLYSTVACQAVF